MLSKEDWMYIKAQKERGVYIKDIAVALGVHPRTVSRAIKRGGAPSGKRPQARKSKLDPYKPQIDQLLREDVWNAVVIFKEIQEKGYDGGLTILREYIHPKRPLRKSRATVRFETDPGVQAQIDWGEIKTLVGGCEKEVHFFVGTLGYSRRFHFWCTDQEDAEHTYEGIIRTFEHFGGITREVLIDNPKCMVIRHRIGDKVRFNERFLDLADHYGFIPRACRPRRAQTKGKDERMVGYVKGNFFKRYRSFESMAHMNQLAIQWLAEEADLRFHGTVKEVVAERFRREAPYLAPLPTVRYDTSYHETRWVAWDGFIDVRGNRYAVPDTLCGTEVTVYIDLDGFFSVYSGGIKVAEHRLRPVTEGWGRVPAYHERLWRDTLNVERRDLSIYEEVAACSL
jgi:transposase